MRTERAVFFIIVCALLLGCPLGVKTDLGFQVALAGSSSRSITMSNDSNLVVDDYKITLYKVEIGNSEDEKFTLWESSDGKIVDLADSNIDLSGDAGLSSGHIGIFQFCRVITGSTISLVGSYSGTPGNASVSIAGNYNSQTAGLETGRQAFLFGTAEVNSTGQYVLTSALETQKNSVISLNFNIDGTVTASPGISLTPPELTLTVVSP